MICDRCFKALRDGDHGEGLCPFEPRAHAHAIVPDDIPGGMVVENGFDTPQTFYSHSEHRAALAARGLEIHAKWAGPHDKYLKRWDIPDATTLANAKALLSRTKGEPFAPEEAYTPMPITVTNITFERDAECS